MKKTTEKVGTVRLQNLSYGHKQAATLMAAVELDLFTKISQGASRLSEIAVAVGINPLNAERLVVACTALGLIEKEGEDYKNARDVERFLVKGKRNYMGPWLLFSKRDFEKWKDLADYLKSKTPQKVLGAYYANLTDEMARHYHDATYSVGLGAGHLFIRDVDLSQRSLMLDLGGGSGCYCIAATQKYPKLKAIVFDHEAVCNIAREFIAQWGLQDRITTQPGDFTSDPLPLGADVMLMASNLPQYSPEVIERVFRSAYEVLAPGGEFHLVGEALDDEKKGPIGPAMWGLHEILWGSEGRSHSEKEVKEYMEKAGFIDVRVFPFIPGSLSRVSGMKPVAIDD
jgi:SAM-dependent methyltransferase